MLTRRLGSRTTSETMRGNGYRTTSLWVAATALAASAIVYVVNAVNVAERERELLRAAVLENEKRSVEKFEMDIRQWDHIERCTRRITRIEELLGERLFEEND